MEERKSQLSTFSKEELVEELKKRISVTYTEVERGQGAVIQSSNGRIAVHGKCVIIVTE